MTEIEQLESELNHKIHELNVSLNTQNLLRERLKRNTQLLGEFEKLFKAIEANLKLSNETIDSLKQENRGLKSSCDEWMKRSIQLEFKILSAGDVINDGK